MDTTVCLICVLALVITYFLLRRPRNLPPGPISIPLVGSIFFYMKEMSKARPHEVLKRAAERYGDVMSFRMGSHLIVALNGYDVVHEALVQKADVFSGRPMFLKVWERGLSDDGVLPRGVMFNQYGPSWKSLRRFTLQVLRDFGVGKTSIEDKILTEIDAVAKLLEPLEGKPVDIDAHLDSLVQNVMFGILFGKRYDYEDPAFHRFVILTRNAIASAGNVSIGNFLPDYLVRIIDKQELERNKTQVASFKQMRDYIQEQIDDHKDSFDKDNIRDFVDLYLRTVQEGSAIETEHLDTQNIFRVIMDLFLAGLETTSTQLAWVFLYLSEFPSVQMKCQEEIARVYGDRTIHYAERGQLVYVEATLMEMQRYSTIIPVNCVHSTTKDTTLRGYNIPKDAMIIPTLWSVSFDPKYWENPSEFRPERFIDEAGNLIKNDAMMTFSSGPRQCLGESLARMELFLVVANLLQRYTIEPEDKAVKQSLESRMHQATNVPYPYNVRVYKRTQ